MTRSMAAEQAVRTARLRRKRAGRRMLRSAMTVGLVALLWGSAGPASANDSALGGIGGAVMPIAVSDIRMESEAVQLIAYARYAAVRVDFKFSNSGEQRKVKLGFPFELPMEKSDPSDMPAAAGFRAWQDGAPLKVDWVGPKRGATVPATGYVGYFVHEADFKPGVTMIRVEYLAEPNTQVVTPDLPAPPNKFKGMLSSRASYEYWVHTGAGWAGTIGKSVIRFQLSPDFQGWGIGTAQEAAASDTDLPKGAGDLLLAFKRPDTGTYEWTFLDYEPAVRKGDFGSRYDVSLHYFQPEFLNKDYSEVQSAAWPPDHLVKASASSELKLGEFSYPADAAFRGLTWAWAEGAKGSGRGQWVKGTFAGKRDIQEIRVLPGYAKSPALFTKYNRPRTLDVEFSDGTATTLRLADDPSLQRFPVRARADWVKVTIGDVYRGTARDETYISLVDVGKTSPEFSSFEEVTGEQGGTEASGESSPTGSGGNATPSATAAGEPAGAGGVPSAALVVLAAAAVAVGVAVVAVVAWMLIRRRRPPGPTS